MYKNYLSLIKPGIIMGNLIASTGGFFFASKGDVDWIIFIAVIIGTSSVVASGCVFNNLIDTDIDAKMKRTRSRPLVNNTIPAIHAYVLGFLTGTIGFGTLGLLQSYTALLFAILGFIVYVGFYSLYYKRNSVHGTLIGSISGACPPVIGYTAVTNVFDLPAIIIFIMFCAWQMPHSYAIAINRKQDYSNANIPVLPIVKGIKNSQIHMTVYTLVFGISTLCLYYYHYIGVTTLILMTLGSGYWLYQTLSSYGTTEDSQRLWGRQIFFTSVILITLLSLLISFDYN